MKNTNQTRPKIRSVKFNVIMNMILTSSSFIFPLVTVPYVSRVLGPSGTGIVAWIQTLINYFALVSVLGITTYGVRACAQVRDNREELSATVQELAIILMVSTAIAYAIYMVSIFFIPKTKENIALALIFGLGIWLSSCGFSWFYQAIEQYGYITVRNLIFKLISITLMFIFVRSTQDCLWYGIVTVIGSYGSNIFNVIRLKKFVRFDLHRKLNIKRHFKPMVSFTISSISSGMYAQIDMLLAGFWVSNAMLGLYQMVVKIKGICYSAVNSVGGVMLPRISYYEAQGGHEGTKRLLGKNINFIVIISLFLILFLTVCAQPIILILGGREYIGATLSLMLISPVLLFSSINTTLSQYLVAAHREKEFAFVNFLGLISGIIFCSILIPPMGINGAAIGVGLCELTALIIRCVLLRDFLKELRGETDILKIIVASAITCVAMLCIRPLIDQLSPFTFILIEGSTLTIIDGTLLILLREKFILSFLPSLKKLISKK